MPTPPPWCSDTQLAPDAVLSSAFSNGQSETASLPSIIASVSRLGLATEPESRWSRPITTGAASSPEATISLKARPGLARKPSPPEGSDAPAKKRPDIGRDEAGKGEGVLDAGILGHLADVVAVI